MDERYIEGRGRLLLACGGYRTGSTLSYNLVGLLTEESGQGHRIGYIEPREVPLMPRMWQIVEAIRLAVAKSHQAPGMSKGAEAWMPLLESGLVRPFCTVRDLRDVLYSFCCKYRLEPLDVLASRHWEINLESMRWWLDNGAIRINYDDLLARTTATAITLANEFGIVLSEERVGQVADDARSLPLPSANDDGSVDPQTLLHRNHISSNSAVNWRTWPVALLARVRAAVEESMASLDQVWD